MYTTMSGWRGWPTLLRWVLGWTGLVIIGWIVGAGLWAADEASCDTSSSLICFDTDAIWLWTGLFAAAVWAAGLAVIAVVWIVVWAFRRDTKKAPDV